MICSSAVFFASVAAVFAAPFDNQIQPDENAFRYINQTLPTKVNEDVRLNVIQLIKKYGYPVEQHSVITEDGYILEMHRIPHGKTNQKHINKTVAFLMHGLLCSSADWVIMGPSNGLAYILADLGYDVWMGNARGNTWSRKHLHFDPSKNAKKFWNFRWNELGYYDLPAMIDHALNTTGQNRLFYIGHSQGTTSFFVMASERPEYNDKIRLMFALAPVAFMENIGNPFLKWLAVHESVIGTLASMIGKYEFLPNLESGFLHTLGQVMCKDGSLFQEVCSHVLFLIAGYDSHQLNRTMIPMITSNTPAGSSLKQLRHYAQEISSGYFRKYDYGNNILNLFEYGSISPPEYDLGRITAPVAMFYGDNDLLASTKDAQKLAKKLPNNVKLHLVEWKGFNHLDFLWAIDVVSFVYEHIISMMQAN